MRSVSVRLDDLRTMILNLGFVGENEHTRVLIDAKKMYDQYPTASASLTVSPPHGAAYPAVIERDGDIISWDVTDSDLINEGAGEFQLAFTVDEVVAKSYIGRFRVSRSIIPTGEIPEPIDDFLTRAGAALTAIPETIDEALGEVTAEAETLAAGSEATALYNNTLKQFTFGIPRGADGQAGAPGRDGTDGRDGQDGAPGADGFSPSASVTKSGSTATITITDKTGTTTAQISDGESGASVIDDNAGVGDTDKVWSANKTATENGALLSALTAVEDATVDKNTIQKESDLSALLTYQTGKYTNKSGTVGTDSNYNCTNKIPVNQGDVFKTSYQTEWRFVCAYNGDTAVSEKGAEYVTTYTVPEGVTHIVITLSSSLSLANRAVIKVAPFVDYENSASKISPSFVQRGARVTFIDDDGYTEFYTHLYPIMLSKGVPMVSAYMGDVCPTFERSTYMTEQQCKNVVAAGGEIVVHGGTNLTSLTIEQAEQNVLASKNALAAHGFKSDIYVYPNSGNNVAIREMMSRHFKCAFKTGTPQKIDTRVNDKCVPHYFIHRCSAGGYFDDKSAAYGNYDTYSLDYFKALIDDAVAKKGWLVFMTHAWMMPIGCSYRLEHDAENGVPADLDEFALIESIIDYIQTLKANDTDIEIVTASEGFEMFKNEVQAGDYLGYWNKILTGAYFNNYWHDKAGFAVNKLGDVDLGGVDMGAWSQKTVTVGSAITLGDGFKTFINNNIPSGTKLVIIAKDDPTTVINNQLIVGACNIDLDSGINNAIRYRNSAYTPVGGADIWTSATALTASPGDKYTIFYQ